MHRFYPRFGTRHVLALLLFLGMAIAYALRVCMSVAIVAMKNPNPINPSVPTYQWSSRVSSTILSSFFWGYVAAQLPSGHYASTWSPCKLLASGMLLCSLLTGLLPVAASHGGVPSIVLLRLCTGLSQGCLFPCAQALLARWSPAAERGRLGAFVMNGPPFGVVVSMPIAAALAHNTRHGWPAIFYFFAGLGIVWSAAFYWICSDRPRASRNDDDPIVSAGMMRDSSEKSSRKDEEVPWRAISTSLPAWSILIAHCGYNWGNYTLLTEMPSYMKYALNFDVAQSGFVSTLPYLLMWLLGFPVGYLSDLSIKHRCSIELARKVCNSLGLWLPALGMLALCHVPHVVDNNYDTELLVAILTLTVGCQAAVSAGFFINHIDLSPNYAGAIMSWTNFVANVCGILAPLACGFVVTDERDVTQWHVVFYITAAVYVVSNAFYIVFGKAEIQSWNNPSRGGDTELESCVRSSEMYNFGVAGKRERPVRSSSSSSSSCTFSNDSPATTTTMTRSSALEL
uniref:Putative inorganic phosphate cotransporter n=1 Tax=Trichogramma kaykai TaxID=54128 RepID=A0ABD2XNP1_9HYME